MRILHISTRLILGGSQENTVLSCEGQARMGHEVHLAFGPIYGPEGSLLQRVEEFNARCERGEERTHSGELCTPIATHVVPSLVREVKLRQDVRAIGQMRTLIRSIRPDVVHTHSSKAGVLGRIAAWKEGGREGRIRVIHTIHGPPFMPVEGTPLQRCKLWLMNRVYADAEKYAAKRCHIIVSVADAMAKQFLARGIGKPEQYVTVHSGMETQPYLESAPGEHRAGVRARLGLRENDFVIGTVARLAQHKGHDDVLDALAADLKAHPDWKLLWVGDGWWRERLIAKARQYGLGIGDQRAERNGREGAQLLITGLVPPDRIPGLMRAMDVLLHPSYREGLPRTVPQALLAGTCPIAYDCDGTPEVLRDRETGLLVPTGDSARLREAVRWAHEHPREREEMAARGRADCADRFSAAHMVNELEQVYQSLATPGMRSTE